MKVDPELPEGLLLSNEGIISGTPIEALNRTMFTFSANDDTASAHISVTAINCTSGIGTILSINPTSNINISFNGTDIFSGSITGSTIFCFEEGRYDYNTTIPSLLNFRVSIPGRIILQRNFYSPDSGYFVIDDSPSSPLVKIPSFIPVPLSGMTLPLTIEGSFTSVQIEPSEFIMYDYATGQLTFSFSISGLYNYTITVLNGEESSSVLSVLNGEESNPVTKSNEESNPTTKSTPFTSSSTFTVGVDVCPEGEEFISILSIASSMIHYDIFDENGYWMKHNSNKSFFCVKPDTSYPFEINHYNEKTDYMFFFRDRLGNVMEFPVYPTVHSTFILNQQIAFGSLLRYTKMEESGWMEPQHRDKKWNEGKVGEWGAFESSKKVYFRKSVTLTAPHDTVLHLHLETDANYVVYVNGMKISEATYTNVTSYRVTIPFLSLKETNVLGVQLTQAENPLIHFDMKVFSVKVPTNTLSTDGSVKEIQKTIDPQCVAKFAFDDDCYSHWKITDYPAAAEYTFPHGQSHIINSIYFYTVSTMVKSFRVEGVNEDQSSTVLLSLTSQTFTQSESIYFDNTVPYSTYRVVIHEAIKNSSMLIPHIRLQQVNPLYCAAREDAPKSLADSIVFVNCPSNQVGKRKLTCVASDYEASWEEDRTGCVPRHPNAGTAFIDMTLLIHSNKTFDEEFIEKIPAPFHQYLRIGQRELAFVYIADYTSYKSYYMEIGLRITLDVQLGDYIHKSLLGVRKELEWRLTKLTDWSVQFERDPILRKPFNWVLFSFISVICILSIMVVVFVAVSVYRGRLIREMKAGLLSNSV